MERNKRMARLYNLTISPSGNPNPDTCTGSVFFVGTATVIIRYAGFTILTDPNFLHAGDHAQLGYGLTSERLTDPAVDIDDLPPLDFCVLSHFHGDHFDRIAAERLDKDLPIITTHHAARKLQAKGFQRLLPLNSREAVQVTKGNVDLLLTAMPAKHAPGILSPLLPPVMGSMLQFGTLREPNLFTLYISGDTLLVDELAQIPRRYPDIDLALLHLGGAKILGLLTVTMDGRQGVEALKLLRPHTAIPIHYNDYTVFRSPLSDFIDAVGGANLPTRIVYLSHGDTYDFEARECLAKAA
jgi:L-ascorbate metabolism protein UlaG (beta-lactamase superfamily)